MSRKVALGGQRLGSGNKNEVELHGFERSTHDLGYIWRSTMAAGTLVPFLSVPCLPGDTFDIDLDAKVLTHPTIGPLFGSFKVQCDLFQIPVRLYNGILHQNKTKIGLKMSDIKLPIIDMEAYWDSTKDDNQQINPSSIYAYLGIRGLGQTNSGSAGTVSRKLCGVPLLGYWDIYKQYYANKQEEVGYYIHNEPVAIKETVSQVGTYAPDIETIPQAPATIPEGLKMYRRTVMAIAYDTTHDAPIPDQIILNTNKGKYSFVEMFDNIINDPGTESWYGNEIKVNVSELYVYSWEYQSPDALQEKEPQLVEFDLGNIDQMRDSILNATGNPIAFPINYLSDAPYGPPLKKSGQIYAKLSSQEGLGIKTYQSDLFNNWLNTEWIDGESGINEITKVSTAGDEFTIDALNLANKIYNMLNRVAATDGSYIAWMQANWDHDVYGLPYSPVYEGGLSKELVFQEVVSNSASVNTETDQPLGTLAGKGVMSQKHKGGRATIKPNEIGWIMGIVSLTPRIDYSQGNQFDINILTMEDFHKPMLDQIGFQNLTTDQMLWKETKLNSGVPTFRSAGKQPAWINYMTAVNQVYGNFAIKGNEMFMVLARQYETDENGLIKDLTTYIDPVKYNQIFAYTKRDAQNFWVQIGVQITARRKMSAKVMPNL